MPEPPVPSPVSALLDELAAVQRAPWLPKVVVLSGETGRGKTYALQRFFDALADARPGCWGPGLAPAWPPASTRQVRRDRKRVEPPADLWDPAAEPSFYWVGVGASAAEGGPEVDMSTVLAHQLHRQLAGLVARSRRRAEVGWEAAKLALEALAALVPGVGSAKTFAEHAVDVAALVRRDGDDPLVHQRRALHQAFVTASRVHSPQVPLVVAIDDAQNAGYETLYLASGLIAVDGSDTGYLPAVLDTVAAGPVLFVCTAWEHRLAGGFDDPFQRWLRELGRLGVDVTHVRCSDLTPEGARDLLGAWDGGDAVAGERILRHIAPAGAGVNPLVLAEGVGRLEEQRDPFSGQLVIDEDMVAQLSISPEQHVRDRLERLREQTSYGLHAREILDVAAHYAAEIPDQLLAEFAAEVGPDQADAVRAGARLLHRHALITPATADVSHRIDPDVSGYLSRRPLHAGQLARLRACAMGLLRWCRTDLFRDDLRSSPIRPYPMINALLGPAAGIVQADAAADPDARLTAAAIAGSELPAVRGAGVPALGFAYAQGLPVDLDDDQVVAAAGHFGESRVTLRIAKRRLLDDPRPTSPGAQETLLEILSGCADLEQAASILVAVLVKTGDVERAVKMLEPLAADNVGVAVRLAGLLADEGRFAEAVDALTPHAADSAQAAIRLAKVLTQQGRPAEAVAALRPHAAGDVGVAVRLAGLLPRPEAIEVLRPMAGESVDAAIALAQLIADQDGGDEAAAVLWPLVGRSGQVGAMLAALLVAAGRRDEAIAMLRPLAAHDPSAARALAELVDPGEAVDVLRPLAGKHPTAAYQLADLLIDRGERARAAAVLRPHAAQQEQAAAGLAELLAADGDHESAMEVLRPLAARYEGTAIRLADLLVDHGRLDEAVAVLRSLAGRSCAAAIRLSGVYSDLGVPDSGIAVLRRFAGDNVEAATRLADLLAGRRLRAEAVDVLVRHAPAHWSAAVRLAGLLSEQGDHRQAITVLRPHAGAEQAALQLADLLDRRGEAREAVAVLRPFAASSEQGAVRLSRLLVDAGRAAEAIEQLRAHPLFPASVLALADLLTGAGRRDEAVEALRPLSGRYQEVALRLAELLPDAEAVEVLRPLAGRFQDVALRLAELLPEADAIAVLRPLAGRFQEAAIRLADMVPKAEAIAVLRPLAGVYDQVAMRLAARLPAADAITVLRPLAGRSEDVGVELARLLVECDQVPEAIELLTTLAGRFPNTATSAARLLFRYDRDDEAVALLRLHTGQPQVAMFLAGTLLRRGQTREVLTLLRGAPGLRRDVRAGALIGAALLLSGAQQKGLARLRSLRGRETVVAHTLFSLLAERGRTDLVALLVRERVSGVKVTTEVPAGYVLRLADRADQPVPAVVRQVWPQARPRGELAATLTIALRTWLDDPAIGLKPLQAASYLEVLLAVGANADLRDDIVARLAAAPETALFSDYAAISPVATDVIAAVAR